MAASDESRAKNRPKLDQVDTRWTYHLWMGVSRNVASNESEELRGLEDPTNFPGLQAEGENSQLEA